MFNTTRTIFKIQSLIKGLVKSIEADSGPAKNGSGKRTTRNNNPGDFKSIAVISKSKVSAVVQVIIGEHSEVEIEIDEDLHEIISVDMADGKLIVKSIEKYHAEKGLRLAIKTKSLESITIEGVVNTNIQHINNETLSACLNGQVQLSVDGRADSCKVKSSGSAVDIDLSKFTTKKMDLTMNGTGNAKVHASENLQVLINGTGNVRYKGNPTKVNQMINGVGFVTPEN